MERVILKQRLGLKAVVLLGILGILILIYAVFDPSSTWWMPKCPVYLLTGFECPGCGSQRAIHALIHGNLGQAFRENAFLIILMPFIALIAFAEISREKYPRLYRSISHPFVIISLLIAVCVWTFLRNWLL